jgi:predicted ArsR family transcriptional regulator
MSPHDATRVERLMRADPTRPMTAQLAHVRLRISENLARRQLRRLLELGLVTVDATRRPYVYRWRGEA